MKVKEGDITDITDKEWVWLGSRPTEGITDMGGDAWNMNYWKENQEQASLTKSYI